MESAVRMRLENQMRDAMNQVNMVQKRTLEHAQEDIARLQRELSHSTEQIGYLLGALDRVSAEVLDARAKQSEWKKISDGAAKILANHPEMIPISSLLPVRQFLMRVWTGKEIVSDEESVTAEGELHGMNEEQAPTQSGETREIDGNDDEDKDEDDDGDVVMMPDDKNIFWPDPAMIQIQQPAAAPRISSSSESAASLEEEDHSTMSPVSFSGSSNSQFSTE